MSTEQRPGANTSIDARSDVACCQWHGVAVLSAADKPSTHVWVKCPQGHGNVTHQHFDYCGICPVCKMLLISVPYYIPPLPTPERRDIQPSRLRARHILPGDMYANWREGYWVGIFAGMIIGAALMALYLWSHVA